MTTPPTSPRIERLATLSTGHLTRRLGADRKLLADSTVAADDLEHGFLLYVMEDHIEVLQEHIDWDDPIDDLCLLALLLWGRSHHLDYIRFDTDGDLVPALPTWSW